MTITKQQGPTAQAWINRLGAEETATTLHERIAVVLGWTVAETQSFDMRSLRELVRTLDVRLAEEITRHIAEDRSHIARRGP